MHIAWAGKDRLIPYSRFGHPMRALVRGAEFSALPGVGHVPMYDDPRLIGRIILAMTTRVDELTDDAHPGRARRKPTGRHTSKPGLASASTAGAEPATG